MNQIYGNASVTIINAAGEGTDCGLPGVSSISRRPQTTVNIRGVVISTVPDVNQEFHRSK